MPGRMMKKDKAKMQKPKTKPISVTSAVTAVLLDAYMVGRPLVLNALYGIPILISPLPAPNKQISL